MTGLLGNIANPFDLPMSAGPNDTFVGMSEYGTPIMRTPTGQQYVVRPFERQSQPAPQPQPEPLLSYGDMRRAARSAPSAIRQGDTGALQGLLSAAVEGLTAPGRAARGENVTLGDVWSTALDYGGVANLAPAPAGALRSGNIRAYHGSPHDFDRFSMDAIGTGEGAQDMGRGLYFYDERAPAELYRNPAARWGDLTAMQRYNQQGPSRVYEVDLNISPNEVLRTDRLVSDLPAESAIRREAERRISMETDPEFAQVMRDYMKVSNVRNADKLAKEDGFKAMSRLRHQGETEFVVFDENLINIVRKYGIAGAAALLGMSVADVEGAMAQQEQKGLLE